MGIGGISIWQLLIILLIVVMLFGTKRLRGLGGDLGGALKGFKNAMNDESKGDDQAADAQAKDADKKPEQVSDQNQATSHADTQPNKVDEKQS